MTTQAISSQLSEFRVGNGASPEVFTSICDIVDINGPNETADPLEASSLCSTSKEFVGGLRDGGEITLQLNLAPTNPNHLQFQTDLGAAITRNYQIALPDSPSTLIDFAAFVTAFGPSLATNTLATAAVTLKVTGDVVYS